MPTMNALSRCAAVAVLTVAVVASSVPAGAAGKLMKLLETCTTTNPGRASIKACSGLIDGIRAGDEGGMFKDQLGIALRMRGGAYKETKDYARALADFTELVNLEPKESYNYAMRSQIYEASGDLDRAIAEYDTVVRLDPSGLSNSSRAKLYLAKGDTARAIADFTVTINSGLKYTNAYFVDRGDIYRSLKQYDKAIADYDELIRQDPGYAPAYRSRALAKEAKGDRLGAAADTMKADEFAKAAARDLPIMDRTFKACSTLSMALFDKFSGKNVAGLIRDCNDDRSEGKQTCNDTRNSAKDAANALGYSLPAAWTCVAP